MNRDRKQNKRRAKRQKKQQEAKKHTNAAKSAEATQASKFTTFGERRVPVTERARGALDAQAKRFKEKFGREPGPGDPVFFDEDADTPQPLRRDQIEEMTNAMLSDMQGIGVAPELIFAFRITDLLLTEDNAAHATESDRKEWLNAVSVGRVLVEQGYDPVDTTDEELNKAHERIAYAANPLTAGGFPFQRLMSDEQWITYAMECIEVEGEEAFFRRMLFEVQGSMERLHEHIFGSVGKDTGEA